MNCLNGANIGARTAIGANFRVNLVNITFRDSLNRTLIDAGSAGGAIVVNYVSHLK